MEWYFIQLTDKRYVGDNRIIKN